MNRIERITYYENLMKEAEKKLAEFEAALESFSAVQGALEELDGYLRGKEWRCDFEACEQGRLPADLPCGVLSEDGIFSLLEKNGELREEAHKI